MIYILRTFESIWLLSKTWVSNFTHLDMAVWKLELSGCLDAKQMQHEHEERRGKAWIHLILLLLLQINFHHWWLLKMQSRFNASSTPNTTNSFRGWCKEFRSKGISRFGVELMMNLGIEGVEFLMKFWENERFWDPTWGIVNSVMINRWLWLYMVA